VTRSPFSTSNILRVLDGIFAAATMAGSFALRLDVGPTLVQFTPQALATMLIGLVVKPLIYHFAGLYRPYWAYVSFREVFLITVSVTASSLSVAVITLALQAAALLGTFPRSVLAIDWLLTLGCISGVRALAHSYLRARESRLHSTRRL